MAPLTVIRPIADEELDTHRTTFDSVKFLSDGLKEFDAHMGAAALSEAEALRAHAEFTGQTNVLDQHLRDATLAHSNLQVDPFANGARDLAKSEAARAALLLDVGTVKKSANQPLSQLQQDQPPGTTQDSTTAAADSAYNAYRANALRNRPGVIPGSNQAEDQQRAAAAVQQLPSVVPPKEGGK